MNMILKTQDPKYAVEILHGGNKDGTGHRLTARLVNAETHEPIPEDEPVFLLRAKDIHAADTLLDYWEHLSDMKHMASVVDRLDEFREFAKKFPERMREPT
jgi:hypothetical protein